MDRCNCNGIVWSACLNKNSKVIKSLLSTLSSHISSLHGKNTIAKKFKQSNTMTTNTVLNIHQKCESRINLVALSACDCAQSVIRNVLTTIHSFSSRQWMTQRRCVYELFHWHNTQLICVKHVKNSWMTISSVRISYPAECNCHLLLWKTSESFSCLLLSIQTTVYKPM